MNIADVKSPALDFWVAKSQHLDAVVYGGRECLVRQPSGAEHLYMPTKDGNLVLLLITKHQISLTPSGSSRVARAPSASGLGATISEAVSRCVIQATLGEELPDTVPTVVDAD